VVTDRVRIDSLAAGRTHLANAELAARSVLVVPVDRAVPPWLAELVAAARLVGATVLVEAKEPAGLDGESAAGWQIGLCTATLAVGADVAGIDPRRVARVREIIASLEGARLDPTEDDGS